MLKKINRWSIDFLFWSTAATTALFFMVILLGVVARFVIKAPILGSVELSRLFFVWACFLAAALCYQRNAHVAITFILDRFTAKWQRSIGLVTYGITIAFFAVIGFHAVQLVFMLRTTKLPVLEISQSWFYVPVPLISVLIILFAWEKAYTEYGLR